MIMRIGRLLTRRGASIGLDRGNPQLHEVSRCSTGEASLCRGHHSESLL